MAKGLMQPFVPYLTKDNYKSWDIEIKELLISQDMWENVEKDFQKLKDQSRLTSTKRDQFNDLRTRDKFVLFLIYRGVDKDTFDIIIGATTKYTWDILRKKYEEINTETTHEVKEFQEAMERGQKIYEFKEETREVQEINEFKKET